MLGPVLLVHAGVTWFLVGLIWTVQVVHYPLFDRVEEQGFTGFEADHQRRISRIVAPAMLLEGVTGLALLFMLEPIWMPITGLVLIGVVWGVTVVWSIPCHRRLSIGFDADAHRRLVTTNWARTAAWSLRGLLVGVMLSRVPLA